MFSIYVLAIVILSHLLFRWIMYPMWFSPLGKIPNAHWSAPFSSFWIQWRRYLGKEVETVCDAIQRKGNIVRLGPSELLVNDYDGGVRKIYGGGFEKPDWYTFYENHGQRNIFTSLGKDHVPRRRRITNVYSKTFIQDSPQVREILSTLVFQRYLPVLQNASHKQIPFGILGLNLAYGIDAVGAFMVGLPRATQFILDVEARNIWLDAYLESHPSDYMFWLLEAPTLTRFLAKIGLDPIPKSVEQAHHKLEEWALRLTDETEEAWNEANLKPHSGRDTPIVYNQLRLAISQELRNSGLKEDEASLYEVQRLELASEILDQLVATRDVFGITFTYILWEISKHPEWQEKLQAELRSVPNPLYLSTRFDDTKMMTPKQLEGLSILQIMIKESMRLRGTLPVPNPRLTPYDRPTTIGPYENIPGGVRTNSFAWCLHRDASVYEDPDVWRPERWIRHSDEREEMDKQFWAFGSGSRLCLGMSFAMEMIRYAVAGIYTNFSTSIVDDSTFCTNGHFVTGLPGEDLVLQFTPLDPVSAST
ncbi:cytochrome P450 [Amniculicola lignicola CBS 123094]|uniref:Cytochrome P450 n=1 Tax=Amniculicola lignicola CBS 123094 TaxID=1392246 RepID=A0A6A5WTQ9_9PLEO|nr:cytochrome P450 [Amniculicola lignicola CBS 123094]